MRDNKKALNWFPKHESSQNEKSDHELGDICSGAADLCKQQPNLARFKVTKTADRENCENTKKNK